MTVAAAGVEVTLPAPPPQPANEIVTTITAMAACQLPTPLKALSVLARRERNQPASRLRYIPHTIPTGRSGVSGRGRAGHANALPDVLTVTVKIATAPFVTATPDGTLQLPPVGAPVHTKFNVPLNPAPGVACSWYWADCPAETEAITFPPLDAAPIVAAGTALPLCVMACGELGASSVSSRLAVRTPGASGANVTVMVQLAPAAIALVHVWVAKLKSPGSAPPNAMLEMCSGKVPEFVTVTFSVVLVPWVMVVKLTLEGVVTAGAGARPVPKSGITCIPGVPLSVIVKEAVRVPAAAGVNVTKTVQKLAGCRTVGGTQPTTEKSPVLAPLSEMEFTLRAWPPVLVMSKLCAVLDCPVVILPKENKAGTNDAEGPSTGCVPGCNEKTDAPFSGLDGDTEVNVPACWSI